MPRLLPLLFLVLLLAPGESAAQEQTVVDEIVAVVEDRILLRSEVDGIVANFLRQQQMVYSDEIWSGALRQLIDEQILVIHAKRDTTVIVTDDQVQQMMSSRLDQMAAQVGGQSRLEEVYGKTLLEIRAELQDDFRNQLMADQVRNRKLQSIRVTPTDVARFFEQFPTDSLPTLPEAVRVSHIVRYPAVTEAMRTEAREILVAIRDSIVVGGGSFEEWAELFSEDRGSAQNGGRYESMSLGEVVPEFAAVASRADIGVVSQIFETPFGLHILRVNDRRGDTIDYNHILIQFDEAKSDAQVAIDYLTVVRDSILTSDISFAEAARRHSEDQSTSIQGGRVLDPGTGERDLYVEGLGPFWQATLRDMAVDSLSTPRELELLDGRRAYHVVQLHGRSPSHRVDISTDYPFVEQFALRQKQAVGMEAWIDKLRSEVYVEIRVPLTDEPTASN